MKTSRRIAALHLAALPLEAVFSDAPPGEGAVSAEKGSAGPEGASEPSDLASEAPLEPCAIRQLDRGRSLLVAVSPSAYARGVRSGMTEAEGRATYSGLRVREREPSLELVRLERVAELLFAYGPEVEACPPLTLFVELGRSRAALRKRLGRVEELDVLNRLLEDLASVGHHATAALADDPDTARTFAEQLSRRPSDAQSRRVFVVPPGRARGALAGLPVEALAWTDLRSDPDGRVRAQMQGVCEALKNLGVERVGDLAQMPKNELGARFGEAGTQLIRRARGDCQRPLRRYRPPERLEESFELEAPTEDLDPIAFILRRLLHRMEGRLSALRRAAGALTLDFLIEPGLEREVELEATRAPSSKRRHVLEVRFAQPTRVSTTMFAVAREKIGGALPGAVLALNVVAEGCEPDHGAQLDLFSHRVQKTEALAELVGRLTSALGEQSVFSPRPVDTHRPEAGWTAAPFSVEAAFTSLRTSSRVATTGSSAPMILNQQGQSRALPSVTPEMSVIGKPNGEEADLTPTEFEGASWPKPRPRRQEDEPPPSLPPRPTELFQAPEPARFSDGRRLLSWRGRKIPLRSVSGWEHLRTEWWRSEGSPLERDYSKVETEDGRWLWVFTTPQGALFVHGIFD